MPGRNILEIRPRIIPADDWAFQLSIHARDILASLFYSYFLPHLRTDTHSGTPAFPLASNTIHIYQVFCTAGLDSYGNYANG